MYIHMYMARAANSSVAGEEEGRESPVQTVVTRVAHGKPVSTDRLASASA